MRTKTLCNTVLFGCGLVISMIIAGLIQAIAIPGITDRTISWGVYLFLTGAVGTMLWAGWRHMRYGYFFPPEVRPLTRIAIGLFLLIADIAIGLLFIYATYLAWADERLSAAVLGVIYIIGFGFLGKYIIENILFPRPKIRANRRRRELFTGNNIFGLMVIGAIGALFACKAFWPWGHTYLLTFIPTLKQYPGPTLGFEYALSFFGTIAAALLFRKVFRQPPLVR